MESYLAFMEELKLPPAEKDMDVIMVDGQPCRVMDFQHRTPGNLRAFVQVRLRNLTSGNTFDTRLSVTRVPSSRPCLASKRTPISRRRRGRRSRF